MGIAVSKRLGWCAFGIVVTIAGVAAARVAIDVRSAANELPTEIRLARAEGLAVEPSELTLAVSAQDNAAPIYRQAIEAFDKRPYADTSQRLEALGRFLAEGGDAGLVKSSLQKWEKAVELAEAASRKPKCDFQPLWQEGPGREPEDLKPFVKLIGARAILRNDLSELESARRVTEHAGSLPTIRSAIARVEAERIWLDACWRFASVHKDDPSTLYTIRQMVARTDYPYLQDCLRGELVLARARIRRLTLGEEDSKNLDPAFEAAGGMGGNETAVRAAESRVIQLYRRLNAALPPDPQNWDAFEQAFEKISRTSSERFSARLNAYLLPDLANAAQKCKRLEQRAGAIDATLDRMIANQDPVQFDIRLASQA